MRAALLLSLLAAACSAPRRNDDEVRAALASGGGDEAILVYGDRVYYLGPDALPVEQRAFRDRLAGADSRLEEMLRDMEPAPRVPRDGVWAVSYATGSYEYATPRGVARVRRVVTRHGPLYWASVDEGRWTYTLGPFGGEHIEGAWVRLVQGATARSVAVLDPHPFLGCPDGFAYSRNVLVDFRGLREPQR